LLIFLLDSEARFEGANGVDQRKTFLVAFFPANCLVAKNAFKGIGCFATNLVAILCNQFG